MCSKTETGIHRDVIKESFYVYMFGTKLVFRVDMNSMMGEGDGEREDLKGYKSMKT